LPGAGAGPPGMSVPLRQSVAVGKYLMKRRLKGDEKFPLLVELEPLFQCNLSCSFCGKIQYPDHILKKRMPVEQALEAIEESGAPMVSIAGGEPLVHPEVHVIARELI
jgi:MoaA/NifB/PqqE/SkfB family radical SAM enzyme